MIKLIKLVSIIVLCFQLALVVIVGYFTFRVVHLEEAERAQDVMVATPLLLGIIISVLYLIFAIIMSIFINLTKEKVPGNLIFLESAAFFLPIVFYPIFIIIIASIHL
jgi:hypothetical protein